MSWAHNHGEACRSCPDLKEVLEGQYLGSVKAVWSCGDGHRYIMDTQCVASTSPEYDNNHFHTAATSGGRDGEKMEEEEMEEGKEGQLNKHERERCSTPTQNTPLAHLTQPQSSEVAQWTCHSEGETCKKKKIITQLAHYCHILNVTFFSILIFLWDGLKNDQNLLTVNLLHKKNVKCCLTINPLNIAICLNGRALVTCIMIVYVD